MANVCNYNPIIVPNRIEMRTFAANNQNEQVWVVIIIMPN